MSAGPQLAVETCARRLRGLGLEVGDGRITWYGPARVGGERAGSEAAIQALCGLMEVNGRDRSTPRRLGLEAASVAAGMLAAQGELAAAIADLRGRPVGAPRTSVLQAGLLLLSHYFVVATGLDDAVPGPPLAAPGPPFRSADGRWFEIETLEPERWKEFWTRLGAAGADLGRAWTFFRWRYERATCSLPPGLHEAAGRCTLEELRRVAVAAGVSLAPLRAYADVLAEGGTDEARPPRRHTVRRLDGAGLPLAGIRVVEATSRIQGPFAGMLLRMLGADVVRVQPPEGDYGRAALTLHRGKGSVRLDLGTPAGRAELVALVADADVFLHNWRPGKAEEWGLAFDDLVARQPHLVYAGASGWGERPEARQLVGTDFLVQAHTALGDGLNPADEPAIPSRIILCDLFGALVGTEAVLGGLYRRERTATGSGVESSLWAGAMALQAHVLEGMARGKEQGRRDGRPVWGILDRPLATADGLLSVSAEDDEGFRRLCLVCGVDPAGRRAAIEPQVAARLADGPASAWEASLLDAGVPAARVCDDLAAVPADPRFAGLFEPVQTGGVAPRSPWCFG